MKEKETLGLMKSISFFKPFTLNEKKTMTSIDSHIVEYKKGEHVIRQWEKDSTIFVLLKGRHIITKNKVPDAELNTLNVGAMFGEVPLITGKTRWIIVIAKKKLPYERNPIPENNKPLKFETEIIASRITFCICIDFFWVFPWLQ